MLVHVRILVAIALTIAGCAPPDASPVVRAPSAPVPAPAVDSGAVAKATGVEKPDAGADGVVKVSWPRSDIEVLVDGWKMPPFMGLTSWVGFAPGRAGVAEAMLMGDLVLFEDEVNPVMSKLFEGGLAVTALHNHFFFDNPKVFFMHVGGEGTVARLGEAVRGAMAEIGAIRKLAPKPSMTFGRAALPVTSSIDASKLEASLGTKIQAKDGMAKAVWGRHVVASCGCDAGKAMGVNTWAAFAGSDEDALVDGDFAVAESELQPVLKSLRASGIEIVAIHHHMTGEQPRILFLHYWGRGKTSELAATVRKALELTAWSK